MDFTEFGKKPVNTRPTRVDRFILPRDYITDMRQRSWHTGDTGDTGPSINDMFESSLERNNYRKNLKKIFSIEPKKDNDKWDSKRFERPWPCAPRKKTYLSLPDSIKYLPTYSSATFPELLDWSKDNVLVAALGMKYHKWNCSSQSIVSDGYTRNLIQCCKFDPRGELLLLGTNMKTVEIHDNSRDKQQAIVRCQNHKLLGSHNCSITAVDWSPTGNSFVTGCSWGKVIAFTRCGGMIASRRVMKDAIQMVRVSPDVRFVAVTAINSPTVMLLTWPCLKEHSAFDSEWTVKTITWHPWRSALLGVGAVTPSLRSVIGVWNAPTSKGFKHSSQSPASLDYMLFSERTGELVVSLWKYGRPRVSPNSQLAVLSAPDTVVDQWGEGRTWLDRVRTMVFNPDGTKLATATSGDRLIIWNFLPEEKRDTRKKNRRFSAIPVYLDQATQGFSFR